MEKSQDGPTVQDVMNYNCKKQTQEFFRKVSKDLKWKSQHMELLMDVGCGTGERSTRFLSFLYPRAAEIIAVDPQKKNIAEAKKFHQYPKVNYVVADIADWSSLENLEGKVSHMVSLRYLNLVQNQKIGFENMFRLLKPGGEVALLFPIGSDIYTIIQSVTRKPKWRPYLIDTILVPESNERDWMANDYESILKNVGFITIEVWETSARIIYPSEKLYRDDIVATLTKTIPKDLKQKFADEILEEYLVHNCPFENGNVIVDYDCVHCFLRKPGISGNIVVW